MRLATRLLSARGPFIADSLGIPLTSQQKKSAQQTSGSEDKAMQEHASKKETKPQQKFYEEVRYAPMLIQSDPKRSRPLFISHLKWITGQTQLKKYFGKYGDLKDVSLYFDAETGIHKGYASVTFENPKTLEKVLKDSPHVIDGDIINVGTEVPRTHKGAKKLNLVNQQRRHSISS